MEELYTTEEPNCAAKVVSSPEPVPSTHAVEPEDITYGLTVVVEELYTTEGPNCAAMVVSSPETVPSTRAVEPEDIT